MMRENVRHSTGRIPQKIQRLARNIGVIARVAIWAKVYIKDLAFENASVEGALAVSNCFLDRSDPERRVNIFVLEDLTLQYGLVQAISHPNTIDAAIVYFQRLEYKPTTQRQYLDSLKKYLEYFKSVKEPLDDSESLRVINYRIA